MIIHREDFFETRRATAVARKNQQMIDIAQEEMAVWQALSGMMRGWPEAASATVMEGFSPIIHANFMERRKKVFGIAA